MAEDEADRSTSPAPPAFLPAAVALPRIEAIVGNARTVWLGQIGFLAFVNLTLVSVRDVDFFSVTATTTLPIVNVAIPTTTFFWAAAWLAAELHTYLHLFLLRLWDALAEAPADLGELGEQVFPWLVNDWALRRRPDRPLEAPPMDRLADTVTPALVWFATPLVLVGFWWRSMPAHDAWLTLAIAGALGLSLWTSAYGWLRAKMRLLWPGILLPHVSESAGIALPPVWRHWSTVLGIILVALSLLRTEIGPNVQVGPFRSGASCSPAPTWWMPRSPSRPTTGSITSLPAGGFALAGAATMACHPAPASQVRAATQARPAPPGAPPTPSPIVHPSSE
jgi:hypothetical protein